LNLKVLVITPRFNEFSGGDGLYAYHLTKAIAQKTSSAFVLTIIENYFTLIKIFRDGSQNIQKLFPVEDSFILQNYYSKNAAKSLKRILESFNPDIVHIHGIHQYFTISILHLLKSIKAPKIFTCHDYKMFCGNSSFFSERTNTPCIKCLKNKVSPSLFEKCKRNSSVQSFGSMLQMASWKYLQGINNIDAFHCGSEFVYQLLSTNSTLRNRLFKIRMPLLQNSTLKNQIRQKPNIVFTGRFVPHKGLRIFTEAVRTIRGFEIDIFGDGPEARFSKRELTGISNVKFHGWKTHDEIKKYLSLNTIVLVPYLAYETFCFVVAEAMINECCVIATGRGAIPELIENNVSGFIIDDPTADNFRNKLEFLLQNPGEIKRIGMKAKELVSKIDDINIHSDLMIEKYRNMILIYNKNLNS
jgi:glycosyltransferase involved in cell wall biosynthesis